MTEQELTRIDGNHAGCCEPNRATGLCDVSLLVAEVRRLRGLIKKSEDGTCRWCDQWRDGPEARLHAADCPAFTPDGAVR
jgi:hypothetical protein